MPIVANAVRISLALIAHRLGLAGSLLTAARLHELIGIAVYLSMLMAAAQLIRRSWAPLIWYFSFTIAIPLLHVGASVKLLGHVVMIFVVAAVIAAIWSFAMKKKAGLSGPQASDTITRRIEELSDWRGKTLARLRQLIHDADPKVEEEWKWMGTPVWSHEGGITTGESYKEVVKLTFFRGAALDDPKKLFNSSLEGNVRRAIDFREGEKINETAFKALIRSAVAENLAVVEQRGAKKKAKRTPKRSRA